MAPQSVFAGHLILLDQQRPRDQINHGYEKQGCNRVGDEIEGRVLLQGREVTEANHQQGQAKGRQPPASFFPCR